VARKKTRNPLERFDKGGGDDYIFAENVFSFIDLTRYTLLRKGEGVMKIRPLQDRILVKRVEEEEKTSGGIIIPDTAKEKPMEGKVVAVGKGKVSEDGKVMPLDVKKGDRILFSKYAGTEVRIEGEEHLIMREEDVLGVIEQ
jgi:chaperonin GroES